MNPKSADLFGTFLETLSTNLAASGAASVADTQRQGPPPAPAMAPPAAPLMAPPGARASSIADLVLKELREREDHSMEIRELLPLAKGLFPALVDALGQLQSYGLVINVNGHIALSPQGKDLAAVVA